MLGSSTTNTRGVPGGVVDAIRPAYVRSYSSSGETYVCCARQSRIAGATISVTSTIPIGHASHGRPIRSPIHTRPNPARIGRQNAKVRIRSGGYQPVSTPSGTAAAVTSAHATRNRRAKPRARTLPATASAVVMKGAYRRQF